MRIPLKYKDFFAVTVRLFAPRASHQPTLLPHSLNRVAAAQTVGAIVSRIERVSNASGGMTRGDLFAGPPSATALCDAEFFSRGRRTRCWRGLLGPTRVPGRHQIRRGRYRGDAGRRREIWRHHRRLGWEATFPRRSANAGIRTLRVIFARSTGAQVHDLNSPDAATPLTTWNAQRFALVRRYRLFVFEAGKGMVDVVHGYPAIRGNATSRPHRRAWWSIDASWKSAIAGAISFRTIHGPARKTIAKFNDLSLGDKSANPQGPETLRHFGEKIRPRSACAPSRSGSKSAEKLPLSAAS